MDIKEKKYKKKSGTAYKKTKLRWQKNDKKKNITAQKE